MLFSFYPRLTTDEVDRGVPARPWSAAEPRWSADRMFSSKQKNWEGESGVRGPDLMDITSVIKV